jgi:hypothetical protein
MDNNIFKILDFVLKKKKITSSEVKNINSYLLNRWISMTESNNVNILNITSNRWLTRKTNIDIIKFYHAVLPKYTKHIKYIKKKTITKNDDELISSNSMKMELSNREIFEYETMLDFLSKDSN